MSKLVHCVDIDMLNPGIPRVIHLVENDSGRQICFRISGMDLTGYSATIWVVKQSGLRVWNNCTVDGQKVFTDITNQMLAEKGTSCGQLKLKSEEDGLVSTFKFKLEVDCDLSGDGIESTNESTVLQAMLADVMASMGIDETLTKSGYAADAKVVGDKFSKISEQIANQKGSGLTDEEKNLILTLFQNAVFTTDQSGNIQALYNLFNDTTVEVTGIVLSASSLNMTTADSKTLTATLKPSGATRIVTWKSSNDSVATVTQTGMVTPVGNGSCVITASVSESISASCTVNVDLSNVVDVTQDGSTLTIIKVPNVTQEDSTLIIE